MTVLLDHPILCALAVTVAGYTIAAAMLWPWKKQR